MSVSRVRIGEVAAMLALGLAAHGCGDETRAPFVPMGRGTERSENADMNVDGGASGGQEASPDSPDGMTLVPASDVRATPAFYIDVYEAIVLPDGAATVVQNVVPTVNIDFANAQAACAAAGKRVCSYDEWLAACEGPDARYAGVSDDPRDAAMVCDVARTTNHTPGSLPSETGSHSRCKTDRLEVWDMIGNAAEWTLKDGTPFPAGVSFYMAADGSVCETGLIHTDGSPVPPEETDSDIGFRCCSDLDQPS